MKVGKALHRGFKSLLTAQLKHEAEDSGIEYSGSWHSFADSLTQAIKTRFCQVEGECILTGSPGWDQSSHFLEHTLLYGTLSSNSAKEGQEGKSYLLY